jgi:mono/diheme cytochrome c family protein
MRTRFISLLFLTLTFIVYVACSNQSSTTTPATTAADSTANTTSSVASPAAELEPVMPEKVQVAFERNCKSCHGPDGHGITGVAPDLRRSARRSLSEWIALMKDEKGAHSNTKIPAMASLTEDDFEAIGGYLADLTQNNAPAAKK